MFKWLFRKPTHEDERLRGWKYAEKYLANGGTVEYLESFLYGARITETWTAFDTGIRDYILEKCNGCS